MSLVGAAGVLELIGGFLLLIGLFTRPVAFILSGEMAFAYFMAHGPRNVLPILNGGELAAVYSFVFLYFALAGAGPWSVDALRGERTAGPAARRRLGVRSLGRSTVVDDPAPVPAFGKRARDDADRHP
jgi:hypothetical protein